MQHTTLTAPANIPMVDGRSSNNDAAVLTLQSRKPTASSERRRIAKMIARDLANGETERAAKLTAYLERKGY